MLARRYILILSFVLTFQSQAYSQQDKLAYYFTGIVYDEYFRPLPYTHVLAKGTGIGDVTDSLGIFTIYIRKHDHLSFYNISYLDTSTFVSVDDHGFYIAMEKRYYTLGEVKVYEWGSSYGDFLTEIKRQGEYVSEGKKLGLPIQDPDYIPFEMNEKALKSPWFLINSPVSFFYYNLSRLEKGARKAYRLERDKELIQKFEDIVGKKNIATITGLKDEELEDFMLYMNSKLQCDYHISELRLLMEIHAIWERYQLLMEDRKR